jgi:hypothetical protein
VTVDCRLDRLIGRLLGSVAPEHARLPPRQALLVQQLEVEVRTHCRLAASEKQRVAKLASLIADPRVGPLRGKRRFDVRIGLDTL